MSDAENGAAAPKPIARILAWEAISSLGESAAETALLLRAGLCNVSQSHFIDAKGERMMLCSSPALPGDVAGIERLAELAAHALLSLHLKTTARDPPGDRVTTAVFLSLPERLADESERELSPQGHAFVEALIARLPDNFGRCEMKAFPFGPAGGAVALQRATESIGRGRRVIWGGVDTLRDWKALKALQDADRLLTTENVDGVRPGEGAAFLLLGPADSLGEVGVLAIGLGREPHPKGSEVPSMAVGLTAALEAAAAPLRRARRRTNYWLLDNSHEAYATRELQNIVARFSNVLGLKAQFETPLKELGDVGAAAMPLLAVLGAEAWRLGHASDDSVFITGCSDSGPRGAVLLAASAHAQRGGGVPWP